jgi:hypothetical protein
MSRITEDDLRTVLIQESADVESAAAARARLTTALPATRSNRRWTIPALAGAAVAAIAVIAFVAGTMSRPHHTPEATSPHVTASQPSPLPNPVALAAPEIRPLGARLGDWQGTGSGSVRGKTPSSGMVLFLVCQGRSGLSMQADGDVIAKITACSPDHSFTFLKPNLRGRTVTLTVVTSDPSTRWRIVGFEHK